jgi:hypothetical protein
VTDRRAWLNYHRHLGQIADADLNYIKNKDVQYDASWKKRGGTGAWFTIVRPMDRLVNFIEHRSENRYDLFAAIYSEGLAGLDGSVLACVRDLRRYLLLVEAEMTERLETKPVQEGLLGMDFAEMEKRMASWVNNVTEDDSMEDLYAKAAAEAGITRQEAKVRILKSLYGGEWPRGYEGPEIELPVRELERRAGLPEPATIAEAEEPMPPADLPLIVEASLFMRLSGPKQRLYTFMGTMHRLTEAVAKTVIMQQLPNVRRFYIMEEGQEYALLDRRHFLDQVDDYFLRLPQEVNGKEFEEMSKEYHVLFGEPQGHDSKRVMKPEYLQGWSRT